MKGEANIERTLGRLQESMEMIREQLAEHRDETKEEFRAASRARKGIYDRLDSAERKIGSVDDKLASYEPDMRRCRMFRHAGIVGAGLIAFGAMILRFWSDLWSLLEHIAKSLTRAL